FTVGRLEMAAIVRKTGVAGPRMGEAAVAAGAGGPLAPPAGEGTAGALGPADRRRLHHPARHLADAAFVHGIARPRARVVLGRTGLGDDEGTVEVAAVAVGV